MINKKEWWNGFFSDLWLNVQLGTKTEEQTCAESDFIQRVLNIKPQSSVLDVPCGDGRHFIELAKRGYKITGVDITQPFLMEAKRKATEQQLEIRWEHRDMRDLPWEEEFDAAFCFWGSFGYFNDDGNADFLKAVYRVIKPGAKFLLDTHVMETLLQKLFQKREWNKVGNAHIMTEKHYDHVSSRTDTDWIIAQDNNLFRKSTSIRLYTYRELCQLLKQVGFANFEAYGSLNGESFQLGSPRLYLTATKS